MSRLSAYTMYIQNTTCWHVLNNNDNRHKYNKMIYRYTIPQNGKWQEKNDKFHNGTNLQIIILNLRILTWF